MLLGRQLRGFDVPWVRASGSHVYEQCAHGGILATGTGSAGSKRAARQCATGPRRILHSCLPAKAPAHAWVNQAAEKNSEFCGQNGEHGIRNFWVLARRTAPHRGKAVSPCGSKSN
ncbi:hypothetical protein GUJ93_ZPchr0033g26862 [Zizania palustris]|uniref:Uncharacterized protein n=1 Tax=Zizania palustris TaxID=103762 RepID=A0A8J5QRT3_ZIZPA|nr:hypothetical protein GUJ93_ZPchr0033g26862 [Zizania palustris]